MLHYKLIIPLETRKYNITYRHRLSVQRIFIGFYRYLHWTHYGNFQEEEKEKEKEESYTSVKMYRGLKLVISHWPKENGIYQKGQMNPASRHPKAHPTRAKPKSSLRPPPVSRHQPRYFLHSFPPPAATTNNSTSSQPFENYENTLGQTRKRQMIKKRDKWRTL